MGKKLKISLVVSILGVILIGGIVFLQHMPLKYKVILSVIQDRPQLLTCQEEFEKLDIIRDWAYENVITANGAEVYSEDDSKQYLEKLITGQEVYGYYCGGIASVLSDVYACFGYNSCILDMAVFSGEEIITSHVITLVYADGLWIPEDATFNMSYTDENGNKLDITSLREKITGGGYIGVEHGNTVYRKTILSSAQYEGGYEIKGNFVEKEGKYFAEQRMDRDTFFESVKRRLEPVFAKDGYGLTFESVYMYPYALYTLDNVGDSQLLEELKESLNLP